MCTVTHLQVSWERDKLNRVLCVPGLEKVPNLECLFVHRRQTLFLLGIRGRHQYAWKKAEFEYHVERLMKLFDLGEPKIIVWPRVFGMHGTCF